MLMEPRFVVEARDDSGVDCRPLSRDLSLRHGVFLSGRLSCGWTSFHEVANLPVKLGPQLGN